MILDRIKASFSRLARNSAPGLDYLALYRAKVNAQSADGKTLDVTPDDGRIPPMAGIPLRHGIPGLTAKVTPGGYVLVGWWNGDPSKPYVALWEGGESTTEITIEATMVNVGGTGGKALVSVDDFMAHIHSTPSGNSGAPTVTIVGTTNMKGK